jgi:DNA-binding LacI/PurR family transcriptional regulator
MGSDAARLLIDLIEAKSAPAKPQRVILQPELVIRDSCGASAEKRKLRLATTHR